MKIQPDGPEHPRLSKNEWRRGKRVADEAIGHLLRAEGVLMSSDLTRAERAIAIAQFLRYAVGNRRDGDKGLLHTLGVQRSLDTWGLTQVDRESKTAVAKYFEVSVAAVSKMVSEGFLYAIDTTQAKPMQRSPKRVADDAAVQRWAEYAQSQREKVAG